MAKTAFITGITGQDGSYLAELLLEKGYVVHGLVRRVALEDPENRMIRLQHLLPHIQLHSGSLESYPSLFRIIQQIKPDECYHLAAQSFVSYSFEDEFSTLNTNINGTHYILSAVKGAIPDCRFYFHPRSAYGISKVAGFELTRNYREAYNLHASSGMLFNHESPRRGFEFVTRKISRSVARIKYGKANNLVLGNLEAQRDWGHAKDYIKAIWLMLQQEKPGDFVISSGKSHSVREFAEKAFSLAGLDYQKYITSDPKFYRAAEVDLLVGDASKAKKALGWQPTYDFDGLVKEMVESDLEQIAKEK
jgi:GDPmannose 4,6-dehydratase